jgi:hypothetical protein
VSTEPRPSSPASEGLTGNAAKYMVYLDWFGWGLGFLYVPGLFFTLLFLLLPQFDDARVARMKLDSLDDNAPFRKKEIEYNQNLFKKGDAFRDKLRQLTYRTDDLAERQRQLDKRRNDFNDKTTTEERDRAQKDQEALDKDRQALQKDREALNVEAGSANYKAAKEMRPEKEKVDKEKEDWQFKKQILMMEQTQSETGAAWRRALYVFGLLFATIILMLGAIGYLSPRQGPWRRVVGAITVGAIVLMIAAKMNGGRSVIIGASAVIKDREVQTQTMPTYAQADTTIIRELG